MATQLDVRRQQMWRWIATLTLIVFVLLAMPSLTAASGPIAADGLPTEPFGVYFTGYETGSLIGGQLMMDVGSQWAQVYLPWRRVETSPGQYDWSQADALFADAVAVGANVIVYVTENPAWAAQTICGPIDEEHLDDFGDFLTAAVQRYSAAPYNVMYWQLYNEPDNGDPVNFDWLGGCWGRTHPNHAEGAGGAAYAEMLKVAYPAVKAGNPEAMVLLGAMAYDNWYDAENNPEGPFDPIFLDELLLADGGDYFDIINFHYFPSWSWVWESGDRYTSDIYSKANYMVKEVRFYTGETKPIFCTEVGLPYSEPPESFGSAPDPLGAQSYQGQTYSEEATARYLIKAYTRGMSFGLRLIVWFEAVDEERLGYKYGLLKEDLTPTAAYYAYKTLTTELTSAQFIEARRDFPLTNEGYDFEIMGRVKTVLWTTDDLMHEQSLAVMSPGGILRVVDKLGSEKLIRDGGLGDLDGLVNGSVSIAIDGSPKYAEAVPTPHIYMPMTLKP
ncbi:MAG: cellulase family glycosylhydrolase [Caldilineales bacterium]|nr:cellulase family glycosylhydrolase [Caldilineales bacterium]